MSTIHLFNSFKQPTGGSELRTVHLYRILSKYADVQVWSDYEPHPELAKMLPIQRPSLFNFPRGGTMIFISVYRPRLWWYFAKPGRLVYLFNIYRTERLQKHIKRFERCGKTPELVFASAGHRQRSGREGPVQLSPIDLQRFCPVAAPAQFTVGRMSRDTVMKHHEDDPELYLRLAHQGIQIRIRGGLKLADRTQHPLVHLEGENHQNPEVFLQGLSLFIYRTNSAHYEPSGRVITEALACGVPVLAHRDGGYVEYIEHGVNGFIFDTEDEVVQCVELLRSNPVLYAQMRAAARQSIVALHERSVAEIEAFYLQPDNVWETAAQLPSGIQAK